MTNNYKQTKKTKKTKIMEKLTRTQIEEIEKMGGTVSDEYITFSVIDQVWGEESKQANKIWDKITKIAPDLDGYLQGHPLDEGDMNYIYFNL